MLALIRKYANSAPVKIFLTILALAFVFCFGISDIIRKVTGKDYIVKIGNIKVSLSIFNLEKNRKHNLLVERGEKVDDEKTENYKVLHEIIWDNIIDLAASDFGFIVSEETIKRYIAGMSVFRDENGRFRPDLLRAFLYKIKVPEPLFIEFSGRDIKSELIKTPFKYISVYNELEYYIQSVLEKRSFAFIELSPSSIHLDLKPSQEELEKFYSEHSDLFLLPETRSFKILKFLEKDIEAKITIEEDEIKEYYDTSPEKDERSFDEMKAEIQEELKQNKLQAALDDYLRQIEDTLIGGENVEEVAKKFNLDIISVHDVTAENTSGKMKDILKFPYKNDVLSVAFSTDDNTASSFTEAMETNGNRVMWLVYVDSITPKHVEAFSSAKEIVKSKFIETKKHEKMLEFAKSLSEEKGSAFEKITAHHGYSISITPPFNRYGKTEDDKKKNAIKTKNEKIISKLSDFVFDTSEDKISYAEIDGNIIVYRVNKIIPCETVGQTERTQLHVNLIKEITTDMHQQLVNYISKEKEVKVNYEMLEEATGSKPTEDLVF